MKKIGILSLVVIVVMVAMYVVIPSDLVVTKIVKAPANMDAVFRNLSNQQNWKKWWPGRSVADTDKKLSFVLDEYQFSINKILQNSFEIAIQKDHENDSSFLSLLPVGKDSVIISWTTKIHGGSNVFSRLSLYFKALLIKKKLTTISAAMLSYVSQCANLYGINIQKEKVDVEFMVTTSKIFPHYPTTSEVYGIVHDIGNYITKNHGEQESYPMLNVRAPDSTGYKVQLAIPIKEKIPGDEIFSVKALFKGGNILVAEISGDDKNVKEGITNFNQYILDYEKTVMAIPFQLLITDRSRQTDSTKWITRLYYPVM